MDNLLTIKEVAASLQIHPQTVKRYISDGRLKAVKIGYRVTRITSPDLQEFIQSRKGDSYFNHETK